MNRACLLFLLLPSALAAQSRTVAPATAPSRVRVTAPNEPGERLAISGIVYKEDGRTPLPAASIYVYQTDARGYYDPTNARDSDRPRLTGYLRADDRGRYAFETVKPGSYPGTSNPGHIHYHVSAPGYLERVFEIVFEGDPLIPAQWVRDATRPNAGVAIVKLSGSASQGWRGMQDVTLAPAR